VFPEEGTTRDAVSEWVRWQGMDVKFIDCAGLRNTGIKIEQIGVERSWQLIDNSELVILVTPTNEELKSEEYEVVKRRKNKGGILGIINKTDLGQDKGKQEFFKTNNIPFISISAIIQDQRNTIQNFLMKTLEDKRSDIEYGSIVCTPRQETILRKVIYYLSEMESAGKDQEEILAEYGRKIQEQLDDFTGKCTSEDIINSIFQKFCIGK
jgi:tRNA modification GTPase